VVTRKTGKPDPGMMVNGMLAGLVAITAPCAFTSPAWSAVIGGIAGVLVIYAAEFIERVLKVDDPVGAIAVHGVCGTFGVLAVGIFANGSYGGGWNGSDVTAVEGVVAGEFGQLGAQLLGVAVLWTVILGLAYAFFRIQNAVMAGGIRVSEADELDGVDLPEMGALAYPEFEQIDVIAVDTGGISPTNEQPDPDKVPV
jgi:Amt family ammonium transporter